MSETEYVTAPGRILASQYAIIKSILRDLDIHNLKNCQKVCKQWEEVGTIIRKDRQKSRPAVFFWEGKTENYYKENPKPYDGIEDPKFYQSPSHHEFSKNLDEYRNRMMFDPCHILVLSSMNIEPADCWHLDTSNLASTFPGATISGMEVRGIVGSTCTVKEDGSLEYTSKEKENYPRSVPCVSLIFFSAWPGVTFTPFTVDGQRQETLEEVFHSTFLRKTNSEKVSAAVVLTNTQSQDVIEFPKLLRKQYPGTIVSGGIGDLPWSTALNGQHLKRNLEKAYDGDDEELIVGFTVAGDKVESASVLLSSSVRSTKKVEEKLLELKGKVREENAVGFMFACCGRGKGFYKGKNNVESGAFRKLFPSIPLIGIFGNGEIGFDSATMPADQELSEDDLLHGFTTVFLIISLGI